MYPRTAVARSKGIPECLTTNGPKSFLILLTTHLSAHTEDGQDCKHNSFYEAGIRRLRFREAGRRPPISSHFMGLRVFVGKGHATRKMTNISLLVDLPGQKQNIKLILTIRWCPVGRLLVHSWQRNLLR